MMMTRRIAMIEWKNAWMNEVNEIIWYEVTRNEIKRTRNDMKLYDMKTWSWHEMKEWMNGWNEFNERNEWNKCKECNKLMDYLLTKTIQPN